MQCRQNSHDIICDTIFFLPFSREQHRIQERRVGRDINTQILTVYTVHTYMDAYTRSLLNRKSLTNSYYHVWNHYMLLIAIYWTLKKYVVAINFEMNIQDDRLMSDDAFVNEIRKNIVNSIRTSIEQRGRLEIQNPKIEIWTERTSFGL